MTVEPIHSTQQCSLCAAPLERGARKCVKCGAFRDGQECISCGAQLPPNAVRCAGCKKVQRGTPCVACGALLESGVKRCSDCSTWQSTRRRYLPESQVTLALILSIISVLSAIIPPLYRHFQNRSQTYVRVIGAEEALKVDTQRPLQTILVVVANNGKRPSVVKSATLSFTKSGNEAVDIQDTELELLEFKDVLLMPDSPIRLHFASPTMVDRRNGKSKAQVDQQVAAGGTATLTLTVEETDQDGDPFDASPTHTFKADKIKKWIETRVSSQ